MNKLYYGLFLLCVSCNSSNTDNNTSNEITNSSTLTVPPHDDTPLIRDEKESKNDKPITQKPVVSYTILDASNTRYDKERVFTILIPQVDLKTDAFKTDVKNILNDLYHKYGTKKFSANIYDNRTAAENAIKEDQGIRISQKDDIAKNKHWVASYWGALTYNGGQYDTPYLYDVLFYGGINDYFPNHPASKYSEEIYYQPE